MKKIAKLMTVLAIAAFTFTSCEDVPSPFGTVTPPTTDVDDGNTELPYNSVNLNSGWTLEAATADQPWSQGSSYVQATGYQKWDGGETKTNRAVKGWLISPAFSTKGYENVKIFFDHTIKYATYTGWEKNHKVYVTNNYDESNFSAITWVEVTDFKPVASPYTDWTLYSSGELQLPASMAGQEAIHIGFYFEAPADKSTTWELKNFNIEEGIADNSGGGGEPSTETIGTKDNPLTVAQALEQINALADKGKSASKAYVKGKVVKVTTNQANFEKYGNLNYLISDDGTESNTVTVYSGDGLDGAKFTSITDLAAGDEVIVFGTLYKYVNNSGQVTPEIDSGNYLVSLVKGSGGSTTPTGEPKGSGTLDDPFNVVAIAQEAAKLGDKEVSTQDYYFKGKICSVKYTFNATQGTANFNVSDDGSTNGTQFVCYSVYYLGNQAWVDGNTQIKVGDEVIIFGKITNYSGTLETSSKKAYIYSLNGKTEDTGGGDATGLEASFENGKGDFTIDDKSIGEGITYVWYEDKNNKYMKASAYKGGAIAAESWLISPAFSLKGVTAPVLTFNNACNQVKTGTITDHIKVMVYDGTNWTEATIANMPSGTDWTFVDSTVDLTSVAGKEGVKIAFKYVSTTAIAPTWEIKTVSVK